MFKAWNKETGLMMRLEAIPCVRGELYKKDHVLLQFTGWYDKQHEELYEMDVLLIGSDKFLIRWSNDRSGWVLTRLPEASAHEPLSGENAGRSIRLCNYFESDKSSI